MHISAVWTRAAASPKHRLSGMGGLLNRCKKKWGDAPSNARVLLSSVRLDVFT